MHCFRSALVVCLCILGLAVPGWAQESPTPSAQKLIVGVKEAPPFTIKQADNTWSGLSVELWQAIATDLQLSYAWRETDLPGLLQGVADGSLRDAKTCPFTNTPDTHFLIDFHPSFPNVLVSSPCSGHGFKFASAMGEPRTALRSPTTASSGSRTARRPATRRAGRQTDRTEDQVSSSS